ncbi:MAG TPA: hypothetical protein VNA04_06620 [Thermoanaerobaculia bacterium]|nr:hypothetical protein [Thermoanaerobaculia bacterium]
MAKRVRSLYTWSGRPGEESLEQTGWISEAKLRAWEYRIEPDRWWEFAAGPFRDRVREWRTARPDLQVPERLFVGDFETGSN